MRIRTAGGRISGMATLRTYCDGCAAAHALDLVGERWALLVVRELLLGPKRFTDLRAGLPNVSPNVLAQRLRELERAGVVQRRKLAPPAASRVYELTDWGLELEPVITQLGRWGARSPSRPRDAGLGVDSLILSFRTMFDPRAAEGLNANYELHLGEDRFRAVVADGRFEVERGSVERPDAFHVLRICRCFGCAPGRIRTCERRIRAHVIAVDPSRCSRSARRTLGHP